MPGNAASPMVVSVINSVEGGQFVEPEQSLETSSPVSQHADFPRLALVNPLHPTGGHCWHSGDIIPDLWGDKLRHRVGSKLLDLGTAGVCG